MRNAFLLIIIFLNLSLHINSQSLPNPDCHQWAVDLFNSVEDNCGELCDGPQTPEARPINYEIGIVEMYGEGNYYLIQDGWNGFFHGGCFLYYFYDDNGILIDVCTSGYLLDNCRRNIINPDDISAFNFIQFRNCEDGPMQLNSKCSGIGSDGCICEEAIKPVSSCDFEFDQVWLQWDNI